MDKYINKVYDHKSNVSDIMTRFITDLLERANSHDNSKLSGVELEYFTKVPPIKENDTYNGEYITDNTGEELNNLSVALANHYNNNDHHPEHFTNGIEDMDLITLLQMLADWKAGTMKILTGDIIESIKCNSERFGIDDQLQKILINTANKYLI